MSCIYKIINPKGKIYIGQTVDIEKRKSSYANGWNKSQTKVFNSIKKYGFDNHEFEVIEYCELGKLNERERYWQDFYNCCGSNGLNLRATKSTDKSGYFSEETKVKMSVAAKAKKEKIQNLISKRHDWTGKKHSQDTINKMRLAALGKPKTKEHIAKLPQNQKGKFRPKNKPETTLKQINNSPLKKKVNQYTISGQFVNSFISTNEAAKKIGVNKNGSSGGNIRSCATGKLKSAYGFIWRYE